MGSKRRHPQGTWRFPESLTGVGARWESGSLSTVLAHCILEPRKVCDRLSYPKTALPGTPNGRGWESATHAPSTCYILSHVCTHTQHGLRSHMQWVLTCNMPSRATHTCTQHALTQHTRPRDTLPYTCACVQMHAHTLTHAYYTHGHTHTCTHTAVWMHTDPHRPTVTHPCAPPRCSHPSAHR